MGRPIKKTRFSDPNVNAEGTAGKIEVSAYFPTGGSLQQDDNSFIISQRSSRRFKVHQQNDSSDQVLTLKAVAPASLVAGEFCVRVLLGDSTEAFVEKFYNNIIHFKTGAGATGFVKYSLGTAGNENIAISGSAVIDVI
jgi:hypothetical protein